MRERRLELQALHPCYGPHLVLGDVVAVVRAAVTYPRRGDKFVGLEGDDAGLGARGTGTGIVSAVGGELGLAVERGPAVTLVRGFLRGANTADVEMYAAELTGRELWRFG